MPLAKKTTLPEQFKAQLAKVYEEEEPLEESGSAPVKEEIPVRNKGKYSDVINLHLSKGKRLECKMFFTEFDVTMNQGIEMAIDYVIRQTKAGKIKVSKGGISEI